MFEDLEVSFLPVLLAFGFMQKIGSANVYDTILLIFFSKTNLRAVGVMTLTCILLFFYWRTKTLKSHLLCEARSAQIALCCLWFDGALLIRRAMSHSTHTHTHTYQVCSLFQAKKISRKLGF